MKQCQTGRKNEETEARPLLGSGHDPSPWLPVIDPPRKRPDGGGGWARFRGLGRSPIKSFE